MFSKRRDGRKVTGSLFLTVLLDTRCMDKERVIVQFICLHHPISYSEPVKIPRITEILMTIIKFSGFGLFQPKSLKPLRYDSEPTC